MLMNPTPRRVFARSLRDAIACAVLLAFPGAALAQTTSAQNMWTTAALAPEGEPAATARAGQSRLQLDVPRFDAALRAAPLERSGTPGPDTHVWLPMPDGSFELFRVVASPIMEPGLAARYPTITSYALRGVNDASLVGRLSRGPRGMHALLKTGQGMVQVNPDAASGHPYYRTVIGPRDATRSSRRGAERNARPRGRARSPRCPRRARHGPRRRVGSAV